MEVGFIFVQGNLVDVFEIGEVQLCIEVQFDFVVVGKNGMFDVVFGFVVLVVGGNLVLQLVEVVGCW